MFITCHGLQFVKLAFALTCDFSVMIVYSGEPATSC